MAADRWRAACLAGAAAMVFAGLPARAQQNGATPAAPQASGQRPDGVACPDGTSPGVDAGGATICVADDAGGPGAGGFAIYLPDLLIDLFPNPPSRPSAPETNPPGAGQNGGAAQPGTPGGAPAANAALAASPPFTPPRAIAGAFVPDEVLVTVAGDADAVQALAGDYNLQIRSQRTSALLGVTLVRFGIPDGRPVGVVLAQLGTDTRTLRRAPNHVYQLQQAAGIANYAFQRIALDAASANGDNVAVAVIDTAIDETQPALAGVVAESHDAMPDTPMADRGHGTSVVGLIAGVGPFRGMAPGTKIYHARAFEGGKSTMDVILEALDWAAGKDVRVINMSFVGPKNDMLELACAAARVRDMVLVAAAGNNGPKAPYGYPAAYEDVIAVTATDEKDHLMKQANRGAYVYVAAPGVDMLAPVPGGTDLVTGTSFASAIVSGVIADLLHVRPDASATWIEETLAATASDLGAKGRDSDFGYGLINYRSLAQAR